ncbi:MAG: hypothetical protein ACRERC_08885 [Candidatus Binatia bacterium]
MSRRRLLSVCRGVPAWGDANPWAYALHANLAETGFDARLVNLLTESDVAYFHHLLGEGCEDPDQLGGVRRCLIGEAPASGRAALDEVLTAFAPDVAVAWEVDTARLIRHASAQVPLVLIGTHCARLETLIADGAVRDFVGFRAALERGVIFPPGRDDAELAAIQACDLLILPSALARTAQEHFFPAHAGKMYDRAISAAEVIAAEAARFCALRRPFAARDIEVVFVAGRWDAAARGLPLVERIAARLPDRRIALVGECPAPIGVRRLGVLPRAALYEVLGRSKVVVAPGLADPAPLGLFAAAAMDCNAVASPNCGAFELCAEELRVADTTAAAFVERIAHALVRPIDDHRRDWLDGGTADLVATLAAL